MRNSSSMNHEEPEDDVDEMLMDDYSQEEEEGANNNDNDNDDSSSELSLILNHGVSVSDDDIVEEEDELLQNHNQQYDEDEQEEELFSDVEDEMDGDFDVKRSEPKQQYTQASKNVPAKGGSSSKSHLPAKISFFLKPQNNSASSSISSSYTPATPAKSKQLTGGKIIPFDPVNIPKGDETLIDKFLHSRLSDDGTTELLTKYKNMSHRSAVWIPVSVLEQDKSLRQRVTRFLEKSAWDTQWSEEEAFNPAYAKIDRLIDEGELDGQLHFLVKWCSLPYDQSTWESNDTVKEVDPDKIDEYNRNQNVTNARKVSYSLGGRKAPIGGWRKLSESPQFKDGCTLRSYQLEGLNWLMYCWFNKQSSILADEMGLGKTVQSTAFLYQLYRNQNIKGPFLVIVPLSTMGNWEREMKLWTDMNVVVYHGNAASRNLLVETEFYFRDENGNMDPTLFKFDVVLTTYEMAISGTAQLRPIKWRVCILDEAHKLKNKNAKVTEFLKAYTMEHKVLLTGTPLQNSLDELWALLNFLEPEKFVSDKEFQREYGNMTSAGDVERLQLLIKPLMLRRLKEDVEKTIPVKEETIVEVELTTTQKKWYRSILEKNFSWLKQGTKRNNVPQLVNTMIELRKCCIHPWLLNGAEEQILSELNTGDSMDLQMKALVQSSGKMVLIDKLLTKLKAGDHKVLIFSQMTKCLDLIQEYIKHKAWNFERIDGGIRGDFRQAAIDRFSAPGSDSFIFLLCTKAGGVGINLTAADTCIIFDSDWNPQNDLQAQSRLHRIGQKKSVKIYRLITRNTYEREMFDRASMKLGLDKALLQRSTDSDPFDSKNKSTGSLSKQEVEDLLKKGAYGAFMDDGAGDKFCEEDIEQILERRTLVIRHDGGESEARKGSMFSKASFLAQGSNAAVDVNDPNFWDRIAEEAELDVAEEISEQDLIMHAPRARKQTNRLAVDSGEMDPRDLLEQNRNMMRTADPKIWTITDRQRLERAIMQYGFAMWEKMSFLFSRRSPENLKASGRALLMKCLEYCPYAGKDVVLDARKAIAVFYPPSANAPRTDAQGREIMPLPEAPETDLDYHSFLDDAAPDYLESVSRKSKNILIRVALLHQIREKIRPDKDTFVPIFQGIQPAPWWGPDQDRDLLIGICKHGYQKYSKIWADPEFCFDKIIPKTSLRPDLPEDDELKGGKTAGDEMDVKEEAGDGAALPNQVATTEGGASGFIIPTPSELGVRIRKVVLGILRLRFTGANPVVRKDELGKKAKIDFQKALLQFGLDRNPDHSVNWYRFKIVGGLKRHSDGVLNYYWDILYDLSLRVLDYAVKLTSDNSDSQAQIMNNPDYPKNPDGEMITIDRASKMLKRVELLDGLRLALLPLPNLEERVKNVRPRGGMPRWWTKDLDIYFLRGIDKYGITDDLYVVEDLPFKAIYEEYLKSIEIRKEKNIPSTELIDGKFEEGGFWMKNSILLKHLEYLILSIAQPKKVGAMVTPPIPTTAFPPQPVPSSGQIPAPLPALPGGGPSSWEKGKGPLQHNTPSSFASHNTPYQHLPQVQEQAINTQQAHWHQQQQQHHVQQLRYQPVPEESLRTTGAFRGSDSEDSDLLLEEARKIISGESKIRKRRKKTPFSLPSEEKVLEFLKALRERA